MAHIRDAMAAGEVPGEAAVLPLPQGALFPPGVYVVSPGEGLGPGWIRSHGAEGRQVVLASLSGTADSRHSGRTLPPVGVLARILRCLVLADGTVQIALEALHRVRIAGWARKDPHAVARLEACIETDGNPAEAHRLLESAVAVAEQLEPAAWIAGVCPTVNPWDLGAGPGAFADGLASRLVLTTPLRTALLQCLDGAERLRLLVETLTSLESHAHPAGASSAFSDPASAGGPPTSGALALEEARELRERLLTARIPPHMATEVRRDIDKLRYLGPGSMEHADLRAHIDWILGLPWGDAPEQSFDLEHVQRVLDEEHYGQAKAKERILEYLAVVRLRRDAPAPILCLVGPPGTGKSNLARAVAQALGREFVRLSVGGVRDEAEIRGRRRPHAAAHPGMILETLRNVGTRTPVFVVDDIDKLGHDGHSTDPTGVLLDVVDPERNHDFVDHYMEVPYDLSGILFILTANILEMVPDALLDRLEVIEIPGYTDQDKQQIVRDYLLPRALERHGLKPTDIRFTPAALLRLIREYALEAGLRQLQRQIESICRKCARRSARGEPGPWSLGSEDIEQFLGPPTHIPEVAERAPEVGVATGLAWTPAGGDLLLIETIRMPGGGRMVATGQLGEVMRESVQAAFSLVRTRAEVLGIPIEAFADVDLHVHFPAGGIPKDGPSAGITITLALASLFSNRPVRNDVATTGEVSLRGKVLPVGGIREKVMAAHRTGIRTVIMPKSNLKNLADVPDSVRAEMEFIGVEHMDEVFVHALLEPMDAEEQSPVEVTLVQRKSPRRRARKSVPASRAARQARAGRKNRR